MYIWKSYIYILFSLVTWQSLFQGVNELTHWGRVTHIYVGNLTIIDSDNGLSPGRHQAIIWTNAGILLIGPLGTNFNENLIGIQTFSFKKMHLKMSSAKWRPFCLELNVLRAYQRWQVFAGDNPYKMQFNKSNPRYQWPHHWYHFDIHLTHFCETHIKHWCCMVKWWTQENVMLWT